MNEFRAAGMLLVALVACGTDPSPDQGKSGGGAAVSAAALLVAAPTCSNTDTVSFGGITLGLSRDYGRILRLMDERRLCTSSESPQEAYRFTWVASFDPPIVVRAERHASSYRLVVKRLDTIGGMSSKGLASNTVIALTAREWAEFAEVVERSNFWRSSASEPTDSLERFDGAQWVVEGMRNGMYHAVNRWSPQPSGPYVGHRALGEWLLRHSGLEINAY